MAVLDRIKTIFKINRKKRAIFKDNSLDRKLLENGYFTMPLLEPREIHQGIQIFKQTDAKETQTKYNTLEVNEHEQRKVVYERFDALLRDKWKEIFVDYKQIRIKK